MICPTEKSNLYIAYGSNICPVQMQRRCPDSFFRYTTVLRNHNLSFDRVANLVKEVGKTLPVVIYELSSVDFSKLDVFEGHPLTYRRKLVRLSNGDTAWVYLKNFIEKNRPSAEYVNRIRGGYRANGLHDFIPQLEAAARPLAKKISSPTYPFARYSRGVK